MSEVDFRIEGLTDEQLQLRWPELRHGKAHGHGHSPRRYGQWSLRWVAVIVVAVPILARGVTSGDRRFGLSAPVHVGLVNGVEVRANHVLVILDGSGSMNGAESQVQLQLTALAAAGIAVTAPVEVGGFAIALDHAYSMLRALETALLDQPTTDTVYVISDFSQRDDFYNQPEGIAALRRILQARQLRLYWATVRDEPPPIYPELARLTGGGVIPVMRGAT